MKPSEGILGKLLVLIAFFFAALFLYTKFAGPIPFSVNSVNTTKTDLFNVEETGTAVAIPDTAVVNLGITQTAGTVADAQSKTNQIANKIIEGLKTLGIADKNIKTTNYSVNPNYGTTGTVPMGAGNMMYPVPPIRGGSEIISYTVTQNIEVNVKPIEKANKVVDSATQNGANLVGQVSFSFTDETKLMLENKARAEAIMKAKQKAQNLANLSGIHLGKLVNVVESSDGRPWVMPMMQSGKGTSDQGVPPTNITPGESTVTITVTLFYDTN